MEYRMHALGTDSKGLSQLFANTDNNGTEDDVCLNAHDQSCPLAAKADASIARARARPPRPPIARAMLLHVRRSACRYSPRMARTKPAASMIRTTTSPNAAMPSKVTVTETAPRLPAMAPISTRAKHASTPRKPLRISLVEVSRVATGGGWASPPHSD